MNFEQARANMIEQQIRPWNVNDPAVLATFAHIPREAFVPKTYRQLACADTALPLNYDEYMMPPRLEARLLQALTIQKTDYCLEIGTGSAFVTACLCRLSHHVDSIDIHETFMRQADEKLAEHGFHNYTLYSKDALREWFPERSYDVIALTGAVPTLPERLKSWLAPGGRLFVVEGQHPAQRATLYTRAVDSNEYTVSILFDTDLPYLIGSGTDDPHSHFQF